MERTGQDHGDDDPLDAIADAVAGLDHEPVSGHVAVLERSLLGIVTELDELARSIPQAR